MKKLLLILVLPLLMGAGCTSTQDNKIKYENCIDACNDNNKSGFGVSIEMASEKKADCKNICVEKYK